MIFDNVNIVRLVLSHHADVNLQCGVSYYRVILYSNNVLYARGLIRQCYGIVVKGIAMIC